MRFILCALLLFTGLLPLAGCDSADEAFPSATFTVLSDTDQGAAPLESYAVDWEPPFSLEEAASTRLTVEIPDSDASSFFCSGGVGVYYGTTDADYHESGDVYAVSVSFFNGRFNAFALQSQRVPASAAASAPASPSPAARSAVECTANAYYFLVEEVGATPAGPARISTQFDDADGATLVDISTVLDPNQHTLRTRPALVVRYEDLPSDLDGTPLAYKLSYDLDGALLPLLVWRENANERWSAAILEDDAIRVRYRDALVGEGYEARLYLLDAGALPRTDA